MTASTIALLVVGAACAGFVQGLSGFGFSLVSLSFWVWTLEPRQAAVLAVCGGLSGQLLATLGLRRSLHPARTLPFLAGGLIGLPIRLWLLPRIDAAAFRLFVGALLMLWCPLMLAAPRLPPIRHGGRLADAVFGALGGLMGPLGGYTGALLSLWCTLRAYPRDEQRAIVQNFNLAMLSLTAIGYVASGLVDRMMLPGIAIVVATLVVPALAGMRLYRAISPAAFRTVVLTLLTGSGIAMLAHSLPQVLAAH